MRNISKGQQETMATSSEGNEITSPAMKIPEVFESVSCTIIKSSDQYDMEKQMSAVECDGVKVIVNGDRTFSLEGAFIDVEKAIKQLEALKNMKLANKNATEENKEQASDNCAPVKSKERNRVLKKDLTPTIKQVDHSLSQQVPIDQHVWYYLKRKHQKELDDIAQLHCCIMKVVCDSSNGEITHCLEVVPFCREDSADARKHADDAVEDFARLYQKASEPGIVKESIKLSLALNHSMPERLITELEKMDVFFLRSDDPCLVGPQSCIPGAKQKVSDFISGHNRSQQQMQPDDNRGQAQASATDRAEPMNFKTRSGLTVHVSQGDLVYQSLDAIVNPANERLGNGGGAARAIAKAAGYAFQRECDEHIRKNGKLEIACVTHTSAGNLQPKIRYVIHTVGPRKSEVKDEELFGLVRLTILNCLIYANDTLNIQSIAIPAISSGIFGVPIETVGRASYEALMLFDNHYASSKKKCLRDIYFLNKDEATFSNMKTIFQSSLRDNCESSVDPEPGFNAKLSTSDHPHDMSNGRPFDSRNPEPFDIMEWTKADDMPHTNASDAAGKKAAKENTSDMAEKNANKLDGDKKNDKKDDDDDNTCIICMDDITDKKELPCKHKFCRECIDQYFSKCQPKCPSCGKVHGTLRGDQPNGTMTTKDFKYRLNGYKDCEAIEINYSFNDGVQGANHPNPGAPYRGTHRTAYLPANKEGREVLRLLKRAFDAKLVFTIGRSNTTGQENVVIWNDVHHKTSTTGQYGYPDPTYLKRVTEELAAKGIQ